ncbi:hypothetical protein [Oceanobacillus kimchii]|uniref:hypothetical protein n=1 Tax=Oceanobacillus kimchii TaxID=746691 RepID=UPI003B01B024
MTSHTIPQQTFREILQAPIKYNVMKFIKAYGDHFYYHITTNYNYELIMKDKLLKTNYSNEYTEDILMVEEFYKLRELKETDDILDRLYILQQSIINSDEKPRLYLTDKDVKSVIITDSSFKIFAIDKGKVNVKLKYNYIENFEGIEMFYHLDSEINKELIDYVEAIGDLYFTEYVSYEPIPINLARYIIHVENYEIKEVE